MFKLRCSTYVFDKKFPHFGNECNFWNLIFFKYLQDNLPTSSNGSMTLHESRKCYSIIYRLIDVQHKIRFSLLLAINFNFFGFNNQQSVCLPTFRIFIHICVSGTSRIANMHRSIGKQNSETYLRFQTKCLNWCG